MKKIIAITALVASTGVMAQDREEIMEQLVEATGLKEMFEQQADAQRQSFESIGRSVIEKIKSENPDNEYMKRYEEETQRFMSSLDNIFESQELVDAWSMFYGKNMSVEDLDKVLEYYQSPIGKKDVEATKKAMPEFTRYMTEKSVERFEEEMTIYTNNLQNISGETRNNK
ncbi:DUF2059 domain-containing protein [Halomonas binhaiensis]|uniref:DUF2059 domain-containing protein n=1 Tax=Halomonas binhaiensis TaxID=2562282 RepID=A0A856QPT0_9GAMM|nr:DUF2059 domain-containing protein [Halomonas binhaiensis]QEM81957.2 DUF2059 domain-containing protein [Halomonas binhaiensis]